MTIFVHIGTEKTGTSSIQTFMRINRDLNTTKGIYYPHTPGTENHESLTVFARRQDYKDDLNKRLDLFKDEKLLSFKKNFPKKITEEINAVSPYPDTLVFSNEHLSSRLLDKEDLKSLKQLLEGFATHIKIVVYLRRQDEFLLSTYSTSVKSGLTETFSLPKSPESVSQRYDYLRLLDRWSEVFGRENIITRIYDTNKLYNNDVIQDFLKVIGLKLEAGHEIPRRKNSSLDISCGEYLRYFNKYIPPFIGSNHNPMRRDIAVLLTNLSKGQMRTRNDKELNWFYKQFHESNSIVANKYLNKTDGILFAEDPVNDTEATEAPGLSLDEAIRISAELWKFKNEEIRMLEEKTAHMEAELGNLQRSQSGIDPTDPISPYYNSITLSFKLLVRAAVSKFGWIRRLFSGRQ